MMYTQKILNNYSECIILYVKQTSIHGSPSSLHTRCKSVPRSSEPPYIGCDVRNSAVYPNVFMGKPHLVGVSGHWSFFPTQVPTDSPLSTLYDWPCTFNNTMLSPTHTFLSIQYSPFPCYCLPALCNECTQETFDGLMRGHEHVYYTHCHSLSRLVTHSIRGLQWPFSELIDSCSQLIDSVIIAKFCCFHQFH